MIAVAKGRIDVRIGSLSPAARAALEAAPRRSAWVRSAIEHFAVCQGQGPPSRGAAGGAASVNFEALVAAVREAARPLEQRIAALEVAVREVRSGSAPPPPPPQPRLDLSALAQWADDE